MPQKRIISSHTSPITPPQSIFMHKLSHQIKKHELNAFVDIKLCKTYCMCLFFIIFHRFNARIEVQAILTRRLRLTPNTILLTELSTERAPVTPDQYDRRKKSRLLLSVMTNKLPLTGVNRFQRWFKRLQYVAFVLPFWQSLTGLFLERTH